MIVTPCAMTMSANIKKKPGISGEDQISRKQK
jgi:hypothetical protein